MSINKLKYIFGPVPSRRLGRSLGINVAPSKVCSMDCVYCEVGITTLLTDKISNYFKSADIIAEFRENYDSFKDEIDVVTITAAGEPTLNSELELIVNGLRAITDKKIALLTNSTMLRDKAVFDAVMKFDIVVPSLDAVTEDAFVKINKPYKSITVDEVISNLILFSNTYQGNLMLEILFVKGINDSEEELDKMIDTVKKINYSSVDISTIYRPPAYKGASALSDDELEYIRSKFIYSGINVRNKNSFETDISSHDDKNTIYQKIYRLLKLRPATEDELIKLFGIDDNDIQVLDKNEDIVKSKFDNQTYYHNRRLKLNR